MFQENKNQEQILPFHLIPKFYVSNILCSMHQHQNVNDSIQEEIGLYSTVHNAATERQSMLHTNAY